MSIVLHNLGRRGTLLLLFSLLYFFIGLTVLHTHKAIDESDAVLYQRIPYEIRASLWWTCATVALFSSFRVKWQGWGWAGLMFMPLERMLGHVWELGDSLFGLPGEESVSRASASIAIWFLVSAIIWTLAGFDEDVAKVGRHCNTKKEG